MVHGAHHFAVRTPDVVHENFDGEVVIINLENGNYYSLEGSGAFVWSCVAAGMDIEETVREAQKRFSSGTNGIESAVASFVNELVDENLIAPVNGDLSAGSEIDGVSAEGTAFTAPVLKRFTDMQELLLLDPIHEVDEGGWPTKKVESGQGA